MDYHLQILNQLAYNDEMRKPRYAKYDRLLKYGYRVYSQADEDGIIAEIFKRIGTTGKEFVEIGVGDGTQCNTVALLVDGWNGLWVDSSSFQAVAEYFPALTTAGRRVDVENVNALMRGKGVNRDIDFLSIDIDGNDFWIWRALDCISPRVVCIEYNALLRPPISRVVPYDLQWAWDGSNHYGASLEALTRLGRSKGYSLVGCNYSGANAFFVREDLASDRFLPPFTAQEHYEPIRFYATIGVGHASKPGYFQYVGEND